MFIDGVARGIWKSDFLHFSKGFWASDCKKSVKNHRSPQKVHALFPRFLYTILHDSSRFYGDTGMSPNRGDSAKRRGAKEFQARYSEYRAPLYGDFMDSWRLMDTPSWATPWNSSMGKGNPLTRIHAWWEAYQISPESSRGPSVLLVFISILL